MSDISLFLDCDDTPWDKMDGGDLKAGLDEDGQPTLRRTPIRLSRAVAPTEPASRRRGDTATLTIRRPSFAQGFCFHGTLASIGPSHAILTFATGEAARSTLSTVDAQPADC